jgi:hypothetical protein
VTDRSGGHPLPVTAEIDRIRATLRPAPVGWLLPLAFLASLGLAGWSLGLLPLLAVVGLPALGVPVLALSRHARWRLTCTGESLVLERDVLGVRVERSEYKMEEIEAFSGDAESLVIGFASRRPWALRTTRHRPDDVVHLVALLEEVRRSSAAFWREELAARHQRDRAALEKLRERGE